MSPGLSGGNLPKHNLPVGILPLPQTHLPHTNLHNQPVSVKEQFNRQPKSDHSNPPPTNPKPTYFSKWNRKTVQSAIDNDLVVSFYVANLPQRWLPTDVHLVMSRFGEVMHVDGVTIEASVARLRNQTPGKKFTLAGTPRPGTLPERKHGSIVPPKSFAQAVQPILESHNRVAPQAIPPKNQVYVPRDESLVWLGSCVFGVLKNPMPFNSLKVLFHTNIGSDVHIIPIGGVSFLFRFKSNEDLQKLLQNKPDLVYTLFADFRAWKDEDTAFNQLCWVLVRGTPPGVWSEEFFKVLLEKVGGFIDWSQDTRSRARMDVTEILVLTTNMNCLNCALSVGIGGKQFDIGIIESQSDSLVWERSPSSSPAVCLHGGASMAGANAPASVPFPDVSAPAAYTPCQIPSSSRNPSLSVSTSPSRNSSLSVSTSSSSSKDPFNLLPIINQYMPNPTLSHSPLFSHSPKSIPSELFPSPNSLLSHLTPSSREPLFVIPPVSPMVSPTRDQSLLAHNLKPIIGTL
ncbi:hypothetical protein Tsubulata_031853 [Turnera subulata]|uniref:DUF4283 domain-containing protein n=1 Tax=Turnera subulata TaxID=218843 RepID=A0A9Q0FTR3_9ROSI|nr:hypothetical protein Tsubulata_031853 [Turnera subulata]